MATSFTLRCLHCGQELVSSALTLSHAECPGNAFLRAEYAQQQIDINHTDPSLYRFSDWLPVNRTLAGSSAPVTFRSEKLAPELKLSNLFITFSGYWPEKGGAMRTGSFKECEAYSVCATFPDSHDGVLVVASAGNTGRAFASVCSRNKIPVIVVIPQANLKALWFDHVLDPCVRIIAAGGESDYYDAIHLASLITELDGFFPEGGAKNVARRDGMGTTVLSAITTIGHIPDYYFQAVGSGTGAIAAWEANLRLLQDGRFGDGVMRLFTSQNTPFLLLKNSWEAGNRELASLDDEIGREQVSQIWAPVLSNRKPPYSIEGGFYDAMRATNGQVYGVTNAEAQAALQLFLETEGIDIDPAAAVAVGSLIQAVKAGDVEAGATIMLNITGGGAQRINTEIDLFQAQAELAIPVKDINRASVEKKIPALFEE